MRVFAGRRVGGVAHARLPLALLRVHGGQGVRHHRVGVLPGASVLLWRRCVAVTVVT